MLKGRNDDLLIVMLKIGREHLATGITRDRMLEILRARNVDGAFGGLNSLSSNFETYWGRLFFHDHNWQANRLHHLAPENYFHLLEHEELEEARASSAEAKRTANWSIGIAIATMFISTAISIISIYVAYRTDDVQFSKPQRVIVENPATDVRFAEPQHVIVDNPTTSQKK